MFNSRQYPCVGLVDSYGLDPLLYIVPSKASIHSIRNLMLGSIIIQIINELEVLKHTSTTTD